MNLNLLDYAILLTIAVFVVAGIHNGFLVSILNNAAYLLSLVAAYIFHPAVSAMLMNRYDDLYTSIVYYAEGEEKLAFLEQAKIPIQNLSPDGLNKIVEGSGSALPQPVDNLIVSNIQNQVFADNGATTIGDYYNHTIACFVINVFAFLLLFIVVKAVLGFVIHGLDYVTKFPVLRQFDGILGGAMGFLQSILILYIVFTLVPAAVVLMPASDKAAASSNLITDFIRASKFGTMFYEHNFILSMIKGFF